MFTRTNYSGYLLENRSEVLAALAAQGLAPLFERVVLEHVTYRYPDKSTAPAVSSARIVAHVAAAGVEALLVELDGSSARPTGGVFHLTYSLAPGHKPVESNALLQSALAEESITYITPVDLTVTAF